MRRGDPANWDKYKKAVHAFNDAKERKLQANWDRLCSELNLGDQKVWQKINRLLSGEPSQNAIQPLRDQSGNLVFEDSDISCILQDTHVRRSNSKHSFDRALFEGVNSEVDILLSQEKLHIDSGPSRSVNRDICVSEVKRAIEKINRNTAPGPDGVHPVLILEGINILTPYLCQLFQCCWSSGVVPKAWKRDSRIYIPKHNKDDYHVPKAYRGISLTSVVGKIYERIVTSRLTAWLEQNDILDPLQYAYRKYWNISKGMLFHTLSIYQGFKENKDTIAAYIDFEGAFDALWRKGAIRKLYNIGLTGRILLYIADFLQGRESRNLVNSYTSGWIPTEIGVPQSSVISPIIFILYTNDLTKSLGPHISYADDLFIWATSCNVNDAIGTIEEKLGVLLGWSQKWRLPINKSKTEIMCLSRSGHKTINVTLDGAQLQQVVHLQNLSRDHH